VSEIDVFLLTSEIEVNLELTIYRSFYNRVRQKIKTMKMCYYRPQGYRSHFICQTENPFIIIRIVKHLRFSRQHFFRKSHFFRKMKLKDWRRRPEGPFHWLQQSQAKPQAPLSFAAAEDLLIVGCLGSSYDAAVPSLSSAMMPRCSLA
jgi:hypothetical protein